MKLCSKCEKEKTFEDFNFKDKKSMVLQAHCRDCQREYKRAHYERDRDSYKAKVLLSNSAIKKRNSDYIFEIKLESKCVDCGEDNPNVLEFDHLEDKVHSVSKLSGNLKASLSRLKEEVDKCELVCCNCHRKRTAKRAGWYREYTRE